MRIIVPHICMRVANAFSAFHLECEFRSILWEGLVSVYHPVRKYYGNIHDEMRLSLLLVVLLLLVPVLVLAWSEVLSAESRSGLEDEKSGGSLVEVCADTVLEVNGVAQVPLVFGLT